MVSHPRSNRHSPLPPAAAYLYLKGRIFYYRYRLPKWLVGESSQREIRVSLRTAYQAQASRLSAQLHVFLTALLEDFAMPGKKLDPNVSTVTMLRDMVQGYVKDILDAPGKRHISPEEIRKRLNGYLVYKLDQEAACAAPPDGIEMLNENGEFEQVDLANLQDEIASEAITSINTGQDFGEQIKKSVMELVNDKVFDASEISRESIDAIVKNHLMMQVNLAKTRAARLRGDFSFEQAFYRSEKTPYQGNIVTSVVSETEQHISSSILLSELIEKFCETKFKDGAWNKRTVPDHKNRVSNLLEILGDNPIDTISRQDMRKFRDILQKLPPNWRKKLSKAGCTFEEFLAQEHSEKLTKKSINVIVEAISGMFTWAVNEGLLTQNPAKGLSLKDRQPDIEKRDSFTDEDIKKIFFSGNYTLSNFKNPAHYWVPLISLYTGMRLEEVCQLHCKDIYQEDDFWVIDVSEEGHDGVNDKILKTSNAKRKIPVHDYLIRTGLIGYRNATLESGQVRLFYQLNKTEKSPKYGKQVGKLFSELVKKHNIEGKKSFHSLRHYFSNYFKLKELHTDMFTEVFGHEQKNLAARQYGSRFPVKDIYEKLISQINFEKM